MPHVSITGCILARNEERQIEDALRSLRPWTDQIILIDNQSEDRTVEVARPYVDLVLTAPTAANFDAARNLAIDAAAGDWIFYLDADEQVPQALGPLLRKLVEDRGSEFEAVWLPFRHFFCGKWMRNGIWWPGYTRPQLLKKGRFRYNDRLHTGVSVDGRSYQFPADDPELAIVHHSYRDVSHYLRKLNNYTDGEAESLHADHASHSWQVQLAHFVKDWDAYCAAGAHGDGMQGFLLAFLSGFYRFLSRAKVWDLRRKRGELAADEPVPKSVGEMLTFMTRVAVEGAAPWLAEPGPPDGAARVLPSGWLDDPWGDDAPVERPEDSLGISACIIARNEAGRILPALRSLRGWVDRIILVDNASTDGTAVVAGPYVDVLLEAPAAANLEEVRAGAADAIHEAAFRDSEWLFYLDADERVSPALGAAIRKLVRERGDEFDALALPFRNLFYGKAMQGGVWWPGWKGAQLLRKGTFTYSPRIHSGPQVEGRLLRFPGDDPTLAVHHYAYEDLRHYLGKLNAYTDAEPSSAPEDLPCSWQAHLAIFVRDWQLHYDGGGAQRDEMHGFLQSFLCAFYRFASLAKVWDQRRREGLPDGEDAPLPGSVREMLEFMIHVYRNGAGSWLQPVPPAPQLLPVVWKGPVWDGSGYGADLRDLALAAIDAGRPIALLADTWNDTTQVGGEDGCRLAEKLLDRPAPSHIGISHTLLSLQGSVPGASFHVARTMFETDRLPPEAVVRLNRMDRVWVPTEFNRETFAGAGVDPEKLAVIPGVLDVGAYGPELEPWPLLGDPDAPGTHTRPHADTPPPYCFLSVFDWTLHKGWDVLLSAFAREFGPGASGPVLALKTWSGNGYSLDEIRAQSDAHLRAVTGHGLDAYPNIRFVTDRLPAAEMPRLYCAADAFVLPTRGEGWCRPLMEAMAAGLPTIATAWSGHTAFHDAEVGYPLRCEVVPVSERGAAEIPGYRGHHWAEPDEKHLRQLLRLLVRRPASATKRAAAGRARIAQRYSRTAVGELLTRELARCEVAAQERRQAVGARSQPPNVREHPAPSIPEPDAVLVQAASGDETALLGIVRDHHEAYATRHGMDYVARSGGLTRERAPAWDRIGILLGLLRQRRYRFLVWLDPDAVVVAPEVDPRHALPPTAWLGFGRPAGPHGPHCGALFVRGCEQSLRFFEQLWSEGPGFASEEPSTAALRLLERMPELRRGVTILDDRWYSARDVNPVQRPVVMAWGGRGAISERTNQIRRLFELLRQVPGNTPIQGSTDPSSAPERPDSFLMPPDAPTPVDFRERLGRKLRVVLEGPLPALSSLARVNREYGCGLLDGSDVELSIRLAPGEPPHFTTEDDPRFPGLFACIDADLTGPPDVTIRHHWPPCWLRPEHGVLVVVQPWEGSHIPRLDWVRGAREAADEVWAYSRYVRAAYARSGAPAEKVRVVPLGFDPGVFSTDGPRAALAHGPKGPHIAVEGTAPGGVPLPGQIRIGFVGGTLRRKGADLLLQAYARAFTAQDPVCLVVLDMGTKTFYRGQTMGDAFRSLQQDPAAPQVVYVDHPHTEAELAAFYRTCDAVVLPYRGEGFALVPLEAMACGSVPIVTAGGATDDYLDDSMALRVPFHRRTLPNLYPDDPGEYAGPRWELEPDLGALVDALRWVRDHPGEAKERGRRAAQHVHEHWTWSRAIAAVRERLLELACPAAVAGQAAAREWVPEGRSSLPAPKAIARRKGKREPTISLCMIARDEETRIGACLESVAPHVDEMNIVDTGSRDRTREIAARHGARVFESPWVDDFAAARNRSLELARGEWIFWLDADDVLSASSGHLLRKLARSRPQRDAGFCGRVLIPPAPGEFSATMTDHVKLFPNRPELRFRHRIHEQIIPALRDAGMQVLPSELTVTHTNYDRSPEGQQKKRRRDFRLLFLDLADHPEHPFVLYNLGMTYLYATGEYEAAAQFLRRALARSHPRDSIVAPGFGMLTKAYCRQLDWKAALEANEAGRAHHPEDAELLFQAGQLYQRFHRYEEARACLERLVSRPDPPGYRNGDVGLRSYRGRHELALLFRRMGSVPHCARMLAEVAEAYPDYLPGQLDLVETLQALGRRRDAADALVRIPEHPAVQFQLERLRARQTGLGA